MAFRKMLRIFRRGVEDAAPYKKQFRTYRERRKCAPFAYPIENDERIVGFSCKMQEAEGVAASATVLSAVFWGPGCRRMGADATNVPDGRADKETEKGEFRGNGPMKSVKKYQIVGFDQKYTNRYTRLCAKGQVRNFETKSCKKELILSDACGIVWINLKNLSTRVRGKLPNASAFSGHSNGQFRRNWRKWIGFVKKPFFSLAFFRLSGYTSLINNLLSARETKLL